MIPAEEWEEQLDEKEVDLFDLISSIWAKRYFIASVTVLFIIVGLIVSSLTRVEYESTSTLILEEENNQAGVNQLMQRFGVGTSLNNNVEGLPASVYPEIVMALPFQMNLIGQDIQFSKPDTIVNAYSYFNSMYEPSSWDKIYGYTFGLPWKIKGLFSANEEETLMSYSSSPLDFEDAELEVYQLEGDTLKPINELKKRINVTLTEKGMLEVSIMMPDPTAAANVGKNTVDLLKEYIKEYRTKKAQANLDYAQNQLVNAEKEFAEVQKRLAQFKDSNRNLATAVAQTRVQELQSEHDLAFGVYNSLATKVEDLKLKVQEQTPSFTTLHPFEVPRSPNQPNTNLILLFSAFMGFFLSILYVISRRSWENLKYSTSK